MFDPSAPHIIILLVVILLLFGSKRLPGAARSLGEAMRNFRSEARQMHDEAAKPEAEQAPSAQPASAQQQLSPPAPPDATQQQLADLQRQLADLQRQNGGGTAGNGTPVPETQRTQQPF
ncbi:MAG TPA: Sec-independent protein translocase subunit TatA [Streptosporangiaceae bacterium]|jgi:sec-independent protein translocase protein TatA